MNKGGLGHEGRTSSSADDGLSEIVRWSSSECLVNIGEMLAIEFVEIPVVSRMVFGAVPPIPIATLRNQDFLKRQFPLLLTSAGRILLVEIAGMEKVVPGAVILGSADPYIEVRVDPRTGNK